MPELPEVETFHRTIKDKCLDKKIKSLDITTGKVVLDKKGKLEENLINNKFVETKRIGKNLFIKISNGKWILFHLGMTGSFKIEDNCDNSPEHTKLSICLENNQSLNFINIRKFGKSRLVTDLDSYLKEKDIGIDALSINKERLFEILSGRGKLKTTLMDQSKIAGLGNLYIDEVLYHAKIHPERELETLTKKEKEAIHKKINEVLETAIENKAIYDNYPDDYIINNRKEGKDCPKCLGQIKKIESAGRTTYICPNCQKK